MPCTNLTGPTDAVELVRWKPKVLPEFPGSWHLTGGIGLRCGQEDQTYKDELREAIRASRADIRHGFVKPICEKCKAAMEVRDAD